MMSQSSMFHQRSVCDQRPEGRVHFTIKFVQFRAGSGLEYESKRFVRFRIRIQNQGSDQGPDSTLRSRPFLAAPDPAPASQFRRLRLRLLAPAPTPGGIKCRGKKLSEHFFILNPSFI